MNRRAATVSAAAILAFAGAAQAQDSFTVRGRVYDFQSSHPDFGLSGGDVMSNSAGLVALKMNQSDIPALSFTGAMVTKDAHDRDGHPIAMHMARDFRDLTEYALVLETKPTYLNNPTVDAYDPDNGPYGGGNVLPAPDPIYVPSLPDVTLPTIEPKEPDFYLNEKTGFYITADMHVDNFTLENQTNVIIDGNVRVRVDDYLHIENNCTIDLTPGSSLEFYVGGKIRVDNYVNINTDGKDHDAVTFFYAGHNQIQFGNNLTFYGSIVAPDADVLLHNSVEMFGTIAAGDLTLRNGGVELHLAGDDGGNQVLCEWPDDDKGTVSTDTTGSITSAQTFSQWFTDVPGVNDSRFARYAFIAQGDGSYAMEKYDYDPVNGDLYGNEGAENNGNFTVRIDAEFVYDACGGQFLEAFTDGEMWVYIDNDLVIDLSGAVQGHWQRIDFDRLALAAGGMYEVKVFFASRTGDAPEFRLRTNATLFSTGDVNMPSTGRYD